MKPLIAVVRKELSAYFLSPIALIFIATFLLAVHFSFFWIEGFFARNVADIRPLFSWLPVLLIFLVPALAMRLWSEEERMGTLELLRTFPLRTPTLVLAKFTAGLVLVAVALSLTLPLAISVELLGDLDWGPVLGGYLASLLLAATYLSISLCMSALTSSQIVALVFGSLACGLLYLLGAEPVAALFGNRTAEILRALGSGSRFESIQRGVLDLRDILYYLSLTGFFLAVNIGQLASRRWSRSPHRRPHRFNARLKLVLVALNLLAVNVLVAPVHTARIDLTAQGEFSISPVTERLLRGLDAPLLIRGYFSQKTHPLLAPLVPRIRDLIEEYGSLGGASVRAEFVDPTSDPDLEKEANQAFGIKSVPFQFTDRHAASVVNSYFHVLIKYGDQYQTLGFDDLIEVQVRGMDIDVRLRNLEYDLTRAIQKVRYGFLSLETLFAQLPAPAKLMVLVTPATLPAELVEIPERIKRVATEFEKRAGGRFSWQQIDPDADGAEFDREKIYTRYGLQPLALSLFAEQTFYLHMLLEVGDHREPIVLSESMAEADLKQDLEAALKRAGSGSLKTVGVVAPARGEGVGYNVLREVLGQTYRLQDVVLDEGRVDSEVDVLLLLGPEKLSERALFALDQFLMRGGSTVVLTGSHTLDLSNPTDLKVKKLESGLSELLTSYGVKVVDGVVLDTVSADFPIPVNRDLGGITVQEVQMLRYPAFIDVRGEQLASGNPALAGLPGVIFHWASPVELIETTGEAGESAKTPAPRQEVLIRSSDQAWLLDEYQAQPDFDLYPQLGWPQPGDQRSFGLAVTRTGPIESHYKDRAPPVVGDAPAAEPDSMNGPMNEPKREGGSTGGVLKNSPERSRLVVLGSASLVSDFVAELSRSLSDAYLVNMQLVQNLIDWCLEDVELLKIRSRGTFARILEPTELDNRKLYEWGNYLFALIAVVLIGTASLSRRRNATPMVLEGKEERQ